MKTELTKVQLSDLIDAVNYMNLTDWTKYKEDGNRSGDRISNEEAKKRQADLLNILYGVKSELEEKWSLISELENEKNFKQQINKMKEATNKQEAIISIIDVLNKNPLFLNKCTSNLFAIIINIHTTNKRKSFLNSLSFEQVKNLFIEIKKEYYNSLDFTNKF